MARRPRSRATRAERRMQKERAASALAHGLPVPTPLAGRTRANDSLSPRPPSSAPPLSRSTSSAPSRMPLPVKLLGVGVALLGAVYGITLLRDHKDASPPQVRAQSQAAVPSPRAPELDASSALRIAPAPSESAAQLAARVKAAADFLRTHKLLATSPSTSAAQLNAAAALLPPAPADSAVK